MNKIFTQIKMIVSMGSPSPKKNNKKLIMAEKGVNRRK